MMIYRFLLKEDVSRVECLGRSDPWQIAPSSYVLLSPTFKFALKLNTNLKHTLSIDIPGESP